jgi:hypothetical protein
LPISFFFLRFLSVFAAVFAVHFLGAPAHAMTFRLVTVGAESCGAKCPQIISAEGEIDRETAEEFISFLKERIDARSLRNVVFIHSPGGSVIGAIKLGTVFRRVGTAVVVAQAKSGQGLGQDASFLSAQCMSACVYAIMGGKARIVPPQSKLGVHRTSSFRYGGKDPAGEESGFQKIKTPDALLRVLSSYVRSMGVSGEVVSAAQAQPADSIRILTSDEIRRWRIGREKF